MTILSAEIVTLSGASFPVYKICGRVMMMLALRLAPPEQASEARMDTRQNLLT